MATKVVLCHSSSRLKVGGRARLPLGPSTSTGIVGQRGAKLGAYERCTNATKPHSGAPREGH